MMQSHRRNPCRALAPFVQCYWSVQASRRPAPASADAVLPDATANLIFNMSGFPHREYEDHRLDRFAVLRTRWLSGIRSSPVVIGPTDCTHVVGVRFKPGGLAAFLPMPAVDLAETTLTADDLWPRDCGRLHEQLFELPGTEARFDRLERWLCDHRRAVAMHAGLCRSLQMLEQAAETISMDRLARVADLSPRQYRRRFQQAVGMTPKRLARVLRFRKLIGRIATGKPCLDWALLALDCGYYDQAHLIAEFRDFAGVTPGEYVARQPAVPGFLPIEPPASVFSNTVPPHSDTIPYR